MSAENLLGIRYQKDSEPVHPNILENGALLESLNCRSAVQRFFYHIYGIRLASPAVLSGEAYRSTGITVVDGPGITLADPRLKFGQVIFAEPKIANKQNSSNRNFSWEDYLHMAVFLGLPEGDDVNRFFPNLTGFLPSDRLIFHATNRGGGGGTQIWSASHFEVIYTPVRVKDFIGS